MTPRMLVDGLGIDGPFQVAGLPALTSGAPAWRLEWTRGPADEGLEDVAWTGDARHEGVRWARFGRRGAERIVLLEGIASLVARPARGEACVRHHGEPIEDTAVLRRLSPYLASLDGRLVLHAAALALPRGAVLVCGAAGAGKSTLALAFDGRGVPVLSDDHVAVAASVGPLGAARLVAHPSFPFVDVGLESRRALDRRAEDATSEGKSSVTLHTGPGRTPCEVVAVAFLRRGHAASQRAIRPADALTRLLRDAVFVADPIDDAAHVQRLDACLGLLAQAPPVEWTVPDDLTALAEGVRVLGGLWGGHA